MVNSRNKDNLFQKHNGTILQVISVPLSNMTHVAPSFPFFVTTNSTPQREAQWMSYLNGVQRLQV